MPLHGEPDSVSTELIQASDRHPARVVVAGGGVAALEAILALRSHSATHFDIELLTPEREFHHRPLSVAEPFELAHPQPVDLHQFAADNSARFRRDAVASVDCYRRRVTTTSGAQVGFDALLIATGTTARPILSGALTFRGPQDVPALRALLAEVDAGEVASIAFVVPRRAGWSLPLYELALMTAAYASTHHKQLRIEMVTYEQEPLTLFGPAISKRVRRLLRAAEIRLRTGVIPIVAQPGRLFLAQGGSVAADRIIAAARASVPPLPGIPQGAGGFIPTDPHSRVAGVERVYAAGDVTWFPIKQGGIAAQQADVAAAAIAHDAGLPVALESFEPVMRGILLTGEEPQYLGPGPRWHGAGKIAGRHLAPYLAGHEVSDPVSTDHQAALELALDAADAAAGWHDPKDALRWLDVAEGLNVALPMEYADKRREWTRLAQEA